jgi:hypothetical protein
VSWADANLNDDSPDGLSNRITALEQTINTQLSELRAEVGLAAAAMRDSGDQDGSGSPLGDLEEHLARAVTVSLSAVLEDVRKSLTEAVTDAVAQLGLQLETLMASQAQARPEWSEIDLEEVAASLQHAVLQVLSSFEPSTVAPQAIEPTDAPATARDVARVNQRIDELRSLLLG